MFQGIVNEGEVFKPYDPAACASLLESVASRHALAPGADTFDARFKGSFARYLDGRSAEAAGELCAQRSGNERSRFESMRLPVTNTRKAAAVVGTDGEEQKEEEVEVTAYEEKRNTAKGATRRRGAAWSRSALLESVPMETGLRAMDMLPLPVWVRGVGFLNGSLDLQAPPQLLEAAIAQQQQRQLQAQLAAAGQSATAAGGGNGLNGANKNIPGPPYGPHFPAPDLYRNSNSGALMMTLHRSRISAGKDCLPFGFVLGDVFPDLVALPSEPVVDDVDDDGVNDDDVGDDDEHENGGGNDDAEDEAVDDVAEGDEDAGRNDGVGKVAKSEEAADEEVEGDSVGIGGVGDDDGQLRGVKRKGGGNGDYDNTSDNEAA